MPPHKAPIELLHLAALIDRLNYLERIEAQRGTTPSRTAEIRALTWAIAHVAEHDSRCRDLMRAAYERADERARRLGLERMK